ncbi:MAG: hypothetical protein HY348_04860 [Nitrospira defluvii]|nr:hypothetical protein [Nitrospira defluvii]
MLAAVSSLIIYQVPLKTSRPIDKEAEKYVSVKADRVQARLWQDPFEAVSTHQLKERASKPTGEGHAKSHHTFSDLVQAIKQEGAGSEFLVLPVFMDGNPYANGVESRLKDRYAVVSALGVAGYLPESGEYIRYFEWARPPESSLLVPVEWFLPDTNSRNSQGRKQVLVLWLKDQDFSPNPLTSLGHLVAHLHNTLRESSTTYKVLGPRTSGTLASMLSELKRHPSDITALKGTTFYSSWATAANSFLLGASRKEAKEGEVEHSFADQGLSLLRTIGTDDKLAEQLVEELKRRGVDLSVSSKGTSPRPAPHVALISEWDTLYGRALPLTFVAMAETMAKTSDVTGTRQIEAELEVLRTGVWPEWVHRYSYLAGLDGELPPKGDGKDAAGTQAKGKPGDKISGTAQSTEEVPTGRSQLDYVRRLAETLKHDATEFVAIGVLGSDVYDKLMILQALRNDFPRAIFFTTDLDARMTHPGQGQWTRNLIVASHFGLALHPDLQTPIPPFRDSYQTALFYSALQAVQYLLPLPVEHEEVRNSVTNISYSIAGRPRLYEMGRHGAVDISLDEPRDIPSIHAPRPDLNLATGKQRLPDAGKIGLAVLVMGAALLCALLLNSEFWGMFRARRHRDKLVFIFALGVVIVGLLLWAMRDGAAGEPVSLTQGISVWPTTVIRFVACVLCVVFLWYASMRLRDNDRALTGRFGLLLLEPKPVISRSLIGIHYWRPHPGGEASASDLWQEYQSLGQWKCRLIRIVPQTLCYGLFGWLLMRLFGFPTMPCRGPACVQINYLVLALSVTGMTILMFYVVDATRLCRRLIKIMIATTIQWPDRLLEKEAVSHDVDKATLNEWLGIELIAQRTAVISFMLYYPFVILFLMGVARHTYFDRWDFPIGLMAIFSLNAAYAFGNAVFLRRSAEEGKRTAITQLKAKLIGLPDESAKRKQIERIADLIDNNRQGAFLPFTQHPLFGAIALPTGGTGLVLLIEYLATVL